MIFCPTWWVFFAGEGETVLEFGTVDAVDVVGGEANVVGTCSFVSGEFDKVLMILRTIDGGGSGVIGFWIEIRGLKGEFALDVEGENSLTVEVGFFFFFLGELDYWTRDGVSEASRVGKWL